LEECKFIHNYHQYRSSTEALQNEKRNLFIEIPDESQNSISTLLINDLLSIIIKIFIHPAARRECIKNNSSINKSSRRFKYVTFFSFYTRE
jgi:hypothetical protein